MSLFLAGFASAFLASGVFVACILASGVLNTSDDSESGALEGMIADRLHAAIDDDLNRGGF
jgi:hypothetical protein